MRFLNWFLIEYIVISISLVSKKNDNTFTQLRFLSSFFSGIGLPFILLV